MVAQGALVSPDPPWQAQDPKVHETPQNQSSIFDWASVIIHMGLSENRGYPQIAILMGNMVIIHWNMRYTIFRQTHIHPAAQCSVFQKRRVPETPTTCDMAKRARQIAVANPSSEGPRSQSLLKQIGQPHFAEIHEIFVCRAGIGVAQRFCL